jgi:16S rRNA (guanine527-N7)-methyltransferase
VTSRTAEIGALSSITRELSLPATVLSLLLAHANAVSVDGDRLGLVSVSDLEAVITRHVADSLLFAIVRRPEEGETWVDVGSGAGFPGLVLACCFPGTRFTLSEPQKRRSGFLDLQIARLGLTNTVVTTDRSEQIAGDFDVAVARALADPPVAMQMLRRLSPDGQQVLAVGNSADALAGAADRSAARPGVGSSGRFFVAGKERDAYVSS